MTSRDGLQLLALLAAAYPKEPLSDAKATLFTLMFAPYPAEAVRQAVLLHIQTERWAPALSDIMDRLATGERALDGDQAWGEVLRQVRGVGTYGTPVWSHPAIADAVRALGWTELCQSTNPEADRAHFLRFFATARVRHHEAELMQQWDPHLVAGVGAIGRLADPGSELHG